MEFKKNCGNTPLIEVADKLYTTRPGPSKNDLVCCR